LTSNDLDLTLKIGAPATPALENVLTNFGFSLCLFELAARAGQTARFKKNRFLKPNPLFLGVLLGFWVFWTSRKK